MHIPDGFLTNQVSAGLITASLVVSGFALKKVKQSLFEKVKVPQLVTNIGVQINSQVSRLSLKENANKKIEKMAVVAAFIFAAQMMNFPVVNGTSGHLIGGVLAVVILGPWAGMLMVSLVLIIQALMFGDGGILALGANIFNMGIVASIGGYYLYQAGLKVLKNKYLVIALAGWLSVVLTSVVCSFELAFSKTINLDLVLPAMVSIHALIGIGEAVITVLAIKFLFHE